MPDIDPKRTVAATVTPEYPDSPAAPGLCYAPPVGGGWSQPMLVFACPGCGQVGGIRVGEDKPEPSPSWKIEFGKREDATSLTLSPSINCVGCCGWHGYLTAGVFRSC